MFTSQFRIITNHAASHTINNSGDMEIRRTQFKEDGIDIETSLEYLRIIRAVPHLYMKDDN